MLHTKYGSTNKKIPIDYVKLLHRQKLKVDHMKHTTEAVSKYQNEL